MNCPRCQQENPPQAKFCLECSTPFKRSRESDPSSPAAELERALTEALEQQAATSGILRVISRSPSDVQPVLDTVVEHASRLCSARDAQIFRREDEHLRLVAHHGTIRTGPVGEFTMPISRGTVNGRSVLEQRPVQVADLRAESAEFPEGQAISLKFGHRTVLTVPLMRDGVAIGTLSVRRAEVRPFTDAQAGLLQTFADQAVIAIENVRLFNETKDALERQTATAEILRVISSSPTDVQPVFDAIVRSAARLCDGVFCNLFRFDGALVHLVAAHNLSPEALKLARHFFPAPLTRELTAGRAILDRGVTHIPDIEKDPELDPSFARAMGARSALTVPMFRDGQPIGTINVGRAEPGPFSSKQIELLQTFADQAVIAIENVRLFTELQEKNQALTQAHAQVSEALEQQTATSEILRVISRSPTDVQPVFDAIARNAARLCGASWGSVILLEGDWIRFVATYNLPAWWTEMHIADAPNATRVIRDGMIFHVADVDTDARMTPEAFRRMQALGVRSFLMVPLQREAIPIGSIAAYRTETGSFSDQQVELLKTFADQAVIAIENVRLFTELQEKNSALTEALDQQTATAEILRVISSSPTDLQPVFDTIVRSASRLCAADFGGLHLLDGDRVTLEAHYNARAADYEAWQRIFPMPLGRATASGRAIHSRIPVHIADVQADPEYTAAVSSLEGHRTIVAVPMLREGIPIGTVVAWRREVHPFTDQQIEILQTFANQAVIAIENVRLFKELEARTQDLTRSVDELTALGEVSRVLSSTLDLETVLQTIVRRANDLAGTAGCTIWEYDEARGEFRLRASDFPHETDAAGLESVDRVTTIRKGVGVTTQVMEQRQPVQVLDIAVGGAEENPIRRRLIEAGHHSLLGVPLLSEDEVIGVLAVTRKTPGEFEPDIVRLLSTFATQSALAIQNARLFLEIEDKSRQLEAASQHKSEFLANMSHELRTPLNAVIGFSEVLRDRMFGELNEKQEEYLNDIHASGQHLLSLINDILDLSKIEAGRMELELTDVHLPAALDNALTLIRERAGRRGIGLHAAIDDRIEDIRADERKIKQVLLNLLTNAIKFTAEGGRIDVRATLGDGVVEVSVTDTGVGIAPEDQEAIFEEFRQVGTAAKKVEGTGLGLALSRKFIELHGGRIWVHSEVGAGSTFTFTIPMRRGE